MNIQQIIDEKQAKIDSMNAEISRMGEELAVLDMASSAMESVE